MIKFFIFILFFNISFSQETNFVVLDKNTIPTELINIDYEIIQHTMDIIFESKSNQILLGQSNNHTHIKNLSLVILKDGANFKGEVRVINKFEKKYFALVPFNANSQKDLILKIRIAVARAIEGEKSSTLLEKIAISGASKKFITPPNYKPKSDLSKSNTTLLTELNKNDLENKLKQASNLDDQSKNNDTKDLKKESDRKNELLKKTTNQDSQLSHQEEKLELEKIKQNIKANENSKSELKSKEIETKPLESNLEKEKKDFDLSFEIAIDIKAILKSQSITSNYLINVDSNFISSGFGAELRYINTNSKNPFYILGSLNILKTIKKDNYEIPMWKEIEIVYFKKFNKVNNLGVGIETEPVYYVALPALNAGLKTVNTNFYWLKLKYLLVPQNCFLNFYKDCQLGLEIGKTFTSSSEEPNFNFSATKFTAKTKFRINSNSLIDLSYEKMQSREINSSKISASIFNINYIYEIVTF